MQAQQKLFNKIVFTLFKKFHNAVSLSAAFSSRALCCLAFLSFLCSVFKVQIVRENFAPLRPPCGEHPVRSVSSSSQIQTRLRWALNLKELVENSGIEPLTS